MPGEFPASGPYRPCTNTFTASLAPAKMPPMMIVISAKLADRLMTTSAS
jgi:hypothetical protein